MHNSHLFEAFAGFSLPALCDVAGEAARLITSLRPLRPDLRLIGPAFTVAGTAGDNLALHQGLYLCPPGFVLVASVGGGQQTGHWGELMAVAARHKGLLGLVIDGAVRDGLEIAALPFPVFAAGLHPRKTTKVHPGQVNVPVTCAGIPVDPGDWVFGDEHGVLVLPAVELPAVAERLGQLQQREQEIQARLQQGEALSSIQGLKLS
jgi:4-hydroxy-4-methyl-2-oxoglutarate aldolase